MREGNWSILKQFTCVGKFWRGFKGPLHSTFYFILVCQTTLGSLCTLIQLFLFLKKEQTFFRKSSSALSIALYSYCSVFYIVSDVFGPACPQYGNCQGLSCTDCQRKETLSSENGEDTRACHFQFPSSSLSCCFTGCRAVGVLHALQATPSSSFAPGHQQRLERKAEHHNSYESRYVQ